MQADREADDPATVKGREAAGPLTLTTDYLHVIPKLERAETDRPVTIRESRGIIEAVGLELDNKTKTLKLKSRVTGYVRAQCPPEEMMRRSRHAAILFLLAALAAALASPARAEKADKEKPINFSADQPAEVDFEKRVGTLKGNVVITQGTLTIKADRIDFKQNADNSLSATAYGNPIAFRQKKDDSDEYLRRLRAEGRLRRHQGPARAVRPCAAAPGQRRDPQQLHLVQQHERNLSRRRATGHARHGRRSRIEGARHVPAQSDSPLSKGAGKDAKDKGADAKDNAADAKDSKAQGASAEPKGKSAAKAAAPAKAPVALKPAAEPSKP